LAGYIDKKGKIVINPSYQTARKFSEGLALVQSTAGWGYIDRKGTMVIPPRLDVGEAYDFAEGLALVKSNDKYGFLDKHGNWTIQPQFDGGYSFSEGLATRFLTFERRWSTGRRKQVPINSHELLDEGAVTACATPSGANHLIKPLKIGLSKRLKVIAIVGSDLAQQIVVRVGARRNRDNAHS